MASRWLLSCALLPLALGCGDGAAERGFTRTRVARAAPAVEAGVSSVDRLRLRRQPAAPPSERLPFTWSVPAGWTQLPSSSMRLVDLRAGDPSVECYVAFLPGAAGGLLANVNRWREQMGLAPTSEEELAALPRQPMLGRTGVRIELSGTFSGMGGEPRPDHKLVGAILATDRGTLFVKMTGPAARVDAAVPAFAEFCAGLTPQQGDHDHAAHADDDGHDHAAHAAGDGRDPAAREPELAWEVPPGWRLVGNPSGTIRMFTFEAGPDGAECTGGLLGGTAAGPEGVVALWYRQLEQTPPDAAGFAALPRIPLLGGDDGVLIDLQGALTDMRGARHTDRGLIAAVAVRGDFTCYVKLVGPAAAVAAQRERLVAFCASLRLR